MSTLTTPSVPSHSSPRTLWVRVDAGLWVATRDGAHVGRVERAGPRFRAFTGRGCDLGSFGSLADAEDEVAARS